MFGGFTLRANSLGHLEQVNSSTPVRERILMHTVLSDSEDDIEEAASRQKTLPPWFARFVPIYRQVP